MTTTFKEISETITNLRDIILFNVDAISAASPGDRPDQELDFLEATNGLLSAAWAFKKAGLNNPSVFDFDIHPRKLL